MRDVAVDYGVATLPPLFTNCTTLPGAPICVAPLWRSALEYALLAIMLILTISAALEPLHKPRPSKQYQQPQDAGSGATRFNCACCLSLVVVHIVLLLGPNADGDEPSYYPSTAVCLGASCAAWVLCLGHTFADVRAGRVASHSIKVWLLVAAGTAIASLPDAIGAAINPGGSPSMDTIGRLANGVLPLFIGVSALLSQARSAVDGRPTITAPAVATAGSISDAPLLAATAPDDCATSATGDGAPGGAGLPPNLENRASILSTLFFGWVWGLLSTGSKRPLEHTECAPRAVPTTLAVSLRARARVRRPPPWLPPLLTSDEKDACCAPPWRIGAPCAVCSIYSQTTSPRTRAHV